MLGLSPDTRLRYLLNPLLWAPLRRFADLAAKFDRTVADSGFREAASEVLPRLINQLEVIGLHRVPTSGPLLVVSNHPGSADGLAIAASLPRNDLKIVVSALPFIRSLPNSAQHLIYTDPLEPHKRMGVVRSSVRHLQDGGALLIFPRGKGILVTLVGQPGIDRTLGPGGQHCHNHHQRSPRTRQPAQPAHPFAKRSSAASTAGRDHPGHPAGAAPLRNYSFYAFELRRTDQSRKPRRT